MCGLKVMSKKVVSYWVHFFESGQTNMHYKERNGWLINGQNVSYMFNRPLLNERIHLRKTAFSNL